jgi:acyl carrier protein
MSENITRIRQVMAQALNCPVDLINVNSNQNNISNWDSLHHVKLVVLLEREFNISIPDERVGNMISYKLIEEVINECIES